MKGGVKMNKTTLLIAIAIILSVSAYATAGPSINSVTVNEPDNFYSPCSGNDVVNVVADVSGAAAVMANFSQFPGMDCGNGTDTIYLTNTGGSTWEGSCDVAAEAAVSDFAGGPIIIVALDALPPNFPPAVDNSYIITLYNMTAPPNENPQCENMTVTNMCEELDLSNVNFFVEIQTNGDADCNGGQSLPWDGFKKVVSFNFSSIDMTSEDIGEKMGALGNALTVFITPPGQFGDSYISVDTSAFAELDTNTTISLYGLPFATEPTINGEGSISGISFTSNSPFEFALSEAECDAICDDECDDEECYDECYDDCTGFTMYIPNGDLTFTVDGFSQYNMTDDVEPTVTINSPTSESTVNMEYEVDVTAEGTGSQLSSIQLYVNGELEQEIESMDIFTECTNNDADWTSVDCTFTVMADSEADLNITVVATDFGGEEGLSASDNEEPIFVEFCGSTIENDVTLTADMDCSGANTDGLNPMQDVTIDCNGYSIIGGGAYKGINNRGYNGVTVKNCNIYGFEQGIYSSGGSGLSITNNNVSLNTALTGSGIHLDYVYDSTISNNYVYDNDIGIYLFGSYQNTVSTNTVEDNNYGGGITGYGIVLEDSCSGGCEDSYDNSLTNNIVIGHSVAGIYSYYAYDNNITGGEIYNNDEGIRLESSTANIKNVNFHDNYIEPPLATGLYVDWDSIAYIENGQFLNNGDYAIYDQSPRSVYWTITGAAKCINNSVEIADGNITFNGGTLEMNNCQLTLPDGRNQVVININKTINSLDFDVQDLTANTTADFNFTESAVTLNLSADVTTTMSITGETPGSAPTGFTALKGIDILIDSTTEGALNYALIKMYYTDAELTAANIAESSLKIYYYNETSAAWQLEPEQGVDTANNYVWARVTHFSLFGSFGTAPSGGGYNGGGGGGGGSTSTTGAATIKAACIDDWLCDDWTQCSNGKKTRTCVLNDYPDCTEQAKKPATETTCTIETPKPAQTTLTTPTEISSPTPETRETPRQQITGTFMQDITNKVPKTALAAAFLLLLVAGVAGYYFTKK